MKRAVIFGREVCMQGSPYTMLVYRRAFGGDLFKAIVEAHSESLPDQSLLMQVCWAMCRTLDDSVSDYPDWLREFNPKAFALGDPSVIGVIDSAINAELFRRGAAWRARGWLVGLLERMAGRARAAADWILSR